MGNTTSKPQVPIVSETTCHEPFPLDPETRLQIEDYTIKLQAHARGENVFEQSILDRPEIKFLMDQARSLFHENRRRVDDSETNLAAYAIGAGASRHPPGQGPEIEHLIGNIASGPQTCTTGATTSHHPPPSLGTTKAPPELPLELQLHIIGSGLEDALAALVKHPLNTLSDAEFDRFMELVHKSRLSTPRRRARLPPGDPLATFELLTLKKLLDFPNVATYHKTVLTCASISRSAGEEVHEILKRQFDSIENANQVLLGKVDGLLDQECDARHELQLASPDTVGEANRNVREVQDACKKARTEMEKVGLALFVVYECMKWADSLLEGVTLNRGQYGLV